MTSTPPEPSPWPAFGSAWYGYRVWTHKSRRLIV